MSARLCALVLLLLLLAACAPAAAPGGSTAVPPAPPPLDPAAVALGAQVYAAHCAACHGAALEGEANWKEQNPDGTWRSPPHDATGHTWHHADSVLLQAIRAGGARFAGEEVGGVSLMPAFGDTLNEAEIAAVLAFIKSTWPEEIRAVQWQQTQQEQAAPALD